MRQDYRGDTQAGYDGAGHEDRKPGGLANLGEQPKPNGREDEPASARFRWTDPAHDQWSQHGTDDELAGRR